MQMTKRKKTTDRHSAGILHHLRTRLVKTRYLVISSAVIAGMLSTELITLLELNVNFQTHYIIGFLRSFLLVLFTFSVIIYSCSIRLLGIMVLLVFSMLFDLLILTNTAFYHYLYDFRYSDTISFIRIFYSYEILCLLLIIDDVNGGGRIRRTFTDLMGHVSGGNTHHSKGIYSRKEKTILKD